MTLYFGECGDIYIAIEQTYMGREESDRIRICANIPCETILNIMGTWTLEESCKVAREYLETTDRSDWNDSVDAETLRKFRTWVKIER